MPLPLPLQLQLQLWQVVSLWRSSCKWHQLRPLAFLRKHFANETDTSSVSCRTSCQLPVASCQWAVAGCQIVVPQLLVQWPLADAACHIYHILRRLMAVIKMLSAPHLPHCHLLATRKWSTHVPAVYARKTHGEIGCPQQVLCHLSWGQ